MKESGYYPPGVEYNPNAPWNQTDPEPVKVEVTISQSLSRSTTITVTDYTATKYDDIEYDEDGYINRIEGIDYDFSDSDLKGAYEEQEYTIPELLNYLKAYLIVDINECSTESGKRKGLQHILNCCEGWIVDETEVVEN